jgi:hypothetical protein
MTITRQDLEDAARAAGIEIYFREDRGQMPPADRCCHAKTVTPWSPATNPADSFDLAMKCGIDIHPSAGEVAYMEPPGILVVMKFTPHNMQETCEAIALAAAEMWRNRK